MIKYEFIEQERVNFPVCRLCEVLQIAPSGYYAWCKRKPSPCEQTNVELSAHIQHFPKCSRGTYGSPRIHADITYIDTAEGWLYLAVVLDIYSHQVVGWSMQVSLHADLVLDALYMALG